MAVWVTLRACAREFTGFRTARWLAGVLVVACAVRMALGGWRWRDLGVAGALVALQPFTEWIIHTRILHWRPRRILGREVDLTIGSLHRRHHQTPKDPRFLLIPLRTVYGSAVLDAVLLVAAVLWRPTIATAVVVVVALTLVYEWTHYLIHTDYQPRSRLYRGLWRAHRLHHYKNEHYWFGVASGDTPDRFLGTSPEPATIAASPTAKNLHGL
jgi:hypothetical protein